MADTVSLENLDAEYAFVGALLNDPSAIRSVGAEVTADWFTDPSAALFFDALRNMERMGGGEASWQSIIGHMPNVPEDPLAARKIYVALLDNAVSTAQIPGVLSVIKDRWARRSLKSMGDYVSRAATMLNSDPFILSTEATTQIDRINASRVQNDVGMMDVGVRKMLEAIRQPDRLKGATTGLKSIDKQINGYKRGQLYVIGARPGMGKSAFMCSSLRATAQAGNGVAMFSMEMDQIEVAARFVSDVVDNLKGPYFGNIVRGDVMDHHLDMIGEAVRTNSNLPIHVDASASLTVEEIISRVRRVKAEFAENGFDLSVVYIDHLTEIKASERYSGNPVMEVSETVKRLRVAAKELDTCIVLLCQLSRDAEKRDNKRPTLADLRWTGEIEQAAHVVAFLYRDHYYLQLDPSADPYDLDAAKHKMEFIVKKNRQGECGDIQLWCSMAHSSIRDGRN
jgi:replicative DNA helicase